MPTQTVPRNHVHDFSLTSKAPHENPFTVALSATFTHSSGESIGPIPGFYDGDDSYKIRFSPSLDGDWKGLTQSDDPELDGITLDPITCEPGTNENIHGILQIDPQNPQKFAWSDGVPFVILGFEWDWLFSYHQSNPDRCDQHAKLISDRGFNYIVANLYAHSGFATKPNKDTRPVDTDHVYGPPAMYLFEGENDHPDHARMNVSFFKDFDRLMSRLHSKGIVIHLMLQVQNKGVNWPDRRSPEDDRFWRYVVARYQAYGNLVWDVGKESKNLHRETGDHGYTLERMAIIRETDAYDHLVTVHDAIHRSAGANTEPDEASDFVSDQVHLKDVYRYNREALRRLRSLPKPYMNIEYGYELGVESLKTYTGASTAPWQDLLNWTWSIYLAGAYPCYYYDNTSWDLIKFDPEPSSWKLYQEMKSFLDGLPLNQMQGDNEFVEHGLCLANPGQVYLVYLPEGGNAMIDLGLVADSATFT